MHDLEIALDEISMSLIHIDLCHKLYWYGGHWDLVTLYVIENNHDDSIIDLWGGPDCK